MLMNGIEAVAPRRAMFGMQLETCEHDCRKPDASLPLVVSRTRHLRQRARMQGGAWLVRLPVGFELQRLSRSFMLFTRVILLNASAVAVCWQI